MWLGIFVSKRMPNCSKIACLWLLHYHYILHSGINNWKEEYVDSLLENYFTWTAPCQAFWQSNHAA